MSSNTNALHHAQIMLWMCCKAQGSELSAWDADKLISFIRTHYSDSLFCAVLCGHVSKHLPALAVALCLKDAS